MTGSAEKSNVLSNSSTEFCRKLCVPAIPADIQLGSTRDQLSDNELRASIGIAETDVVRQPQRPNEHMVSRSNNPSPRQQIAKHLFEEKNTKSILFKSPDRCTTATNPLSQAAEASNNSPVPPTLHPSKPSYMKRVMSLQGRGGVSMVEMFGMTRERSESLPTAKSPFTGTVRSAINSILPTFLSGPHHASTTIAQGTPSTPVRERSDIFASLASPPNSCHNSPRRQVLPGSSSDLGTVILPMVLPSIVPLTPLSPLVEVGESSFKSDDGQPSLFAPSDSSFLSIPASVLPLTPSTTAEGPRLRDLLRIGFVLSPRATPPPDNDSIADDVAFSEGQAQE